MFSICDGAILLQMMWDDTTDLGCDFATCSGGQAVVVACNYGPGGNKEKTKLFKNSNYCALRSSLSVKEYLKGKEHVPTCMPKVPCWQGLRWDNEPSRYGVYRG